MQFQVPQFIYRESKIVGPLTFKQFGYIGSAGAICFILYFVLAGRSFFLFFLISAVLIISALLLAFGQYGGRSLPTALTHFVGFLFSKKLYLWKKKDVPVKILMKRAPPKRGEEEIEETSPLKIAEKSRLKDLSTQIETRSK